MRRPYQAEMVREVYAAWDQGARAVLLQAPTGAGKTHTVASLISEWDGPVIFAAHLDALVGDTAARLPGAGIIAPWATPRPEARVQVCSLGTLTARGTRPPASLVVLDEAHRSEAPTVSAILASYPGARLLGLTATPQRGDGRPLGATWERLVLGPSVASLTAMGALVPADLRCPPRGRGDVVAELQRLVPGWRALVFAEDTTEARATAARLRAAGYRVAEVYGETSRSEREETRARLRAGELDALVNVAVAVEGWDEPSVDVVALDAPFGTVGRFLQAIGRGLRPYPGKTRCVVLDVRGAVHAHGLPDEARAWRLTGAEAVLRCEPGLRLSRCPSCWAVFRAAATCPRCGAAVGVADVVDRAPPTRAERLEAYERIPVAVRREQYYRAMVRTGVGKRRMPLERAQRWARGEAERRFPREVTS